MSVSVCVCAAAAAGPAVEGWVAHVCRLPDAEACSVLGARSMSLSLSRHTHKHTHTHTHTPMALAHTTRTHRLQRASLAWERKRGRERKAGKEGGREGMGIEEGVLGDYREMKGRNTERR